MEFRNKKLVLIRHPPHCLADQIPNNKTQEFFKFIYIKIKRGRKIALQRRRNEDPGSRQEPATRQERGLNIVLSRIPEYQETDFLPYSPSLPFLTFCPLALLSLLAFFSARFLSALEVPPTLVFLLELADLGLRYFWCETSLATPLS